MGEALAQQLVNGLTLGSVYALIALGYSMVYSILGMLNFAHGDVYMVGGFIGWAVASCLAGGGRLMVHPALAVTMMVLASAAGCILLGLAIERFAYRPLRGRSRLAPLITALGVSIFLQNAMMLLTQGRAKIYPSHLLIPPALRVQFGGATLSFARIFVIVTALALTLVLDYAVRKTRIGRAIRATAEDATTASMMGINPNSIIALTFAIGSALAGVGGVLVGIQYTQVDFNMGFAAGMKAFISAVVGGIGNLRGAVLGGILLGVVESLGVGLVASEYRDVIAFAVLVLVLILRPRGLMGEQVPDRA